MTMARARDRVREATSLHETTATLTSRSMLITFGSILEPGGGTQVRSRVLAEELAQLGMPPAIVSTREEGVATGRSAPWARSVRVPRRKAAFLIDLVRMVRRAASESDIVIVANALFVPVVVACRVHLPMIWDTNECQSLHYARLPQTPLNSAKRLAWVGLERWAGSRCAFAVAIGESEAAHWKRIHPRLGDKLVVVDHSPFASTRTEQGSRAALEGQLRRSIEGPVLVFVGTMDAKQNRPAAQWIIDVLGPALPTTTTIVLCGTGTEKLRGRDEGARVECLGKVADVDSVIATADLCLAPLTSGAGVKTKVLHYLSHGRRVAGTPLAFEGLAGAPGLFEAPLESLPALVASLTQTRGSTEASEQRANAQRAWMERHHGRQRVAGQWLEILRCLRTA